MDPNFQQKVFRVLYARRAKLDGELTVEKGDMLITVNMRIPDPRNPAEWLFCTTERGLQGIVYKSYVEEVQVIEGRQFLLRRQSGLLRKYLAEGRTELKSIASTIHEAVGCDGTLLTYFVKEFITALNWESSQFSKDNVTISKIFSERMATLQSFLNALQCEERCIGIVIEYFTQVLEDWLSQIANCRNTTEIGALVKELKVHSVVPKTDMFASYLDDLTLTDWSIISEDRQIILAQFTNFVNVIRISSEIAYVFRVKFKECTEKQFISPTTSTIRYRNIYFLCRSLMKNCKDFSKIIRNDEEFLKAVTAHTTQANADVGIDTALSSLQEMSICQQVEDVSMVQQSSTSYMDCEKQHLNPLRLRPKPNNGAFLQCGNNLSEGLKRVLQDMQHKINTFTLGTDFTTIVKIGDGGQADAFLVRIAATSKLMVFKQFGEWASPGTILNELGRLLECDEHRHILKTSGLVFASVERKTPIGIMVDLMEMGSLHDMIYRNKPDLKDYGEKEVLLWSLQMAKAGEHLHSKNLIHRDIKPQNILLESMEHAMLSDFGMAKRVKLESLPKSNCGTMGYRAPETFQKRAYSTPADVYSLGITIWEIAERRNPTWPINCRLGEGGRHFIPDLTNPKYPWLARLLPHMWNYDPEKRPTMENVRTHLEELYKKFE